ncbi:MAG: acylphosphatase [Bacillota bacterium]
MKRVRLIIGGRVQGVSFRYYTRRAAISLGVTGWVRNLPDGRVEVLAEGDDDTVQALVDWCHQGPPSARVTAVEAHPEPFTGEFAGFRVTE